MKEDVLKELCNTENFGSGGWCVCSTLFGVDCEVAYVCGEFARVCHGSRWWCGDGECVASADLYCCSEFVGL